MLRMNSRFSILNKLCEKYSLNKYELHIPMLDCISNLNKLTGVYSSEEYFNSLFVQDNPLDWANIARWTYDNNNKDFIPVVNMGIITNRSIKKISELILSFPDENTDIIDKGLISLCLTAFSCENCKILCRQIEYDKRIHDILISHHNRWINELHRAFIPLLRYEFAFQLDSRWKIVQELRMDEIKYIFPFIPKEDYLEFVVALWDIIPPFIIPFIHRMRPYPYQMIMLGHKMLQYPHIKDNQSVVDILDLVYDNADIPSNKEICNILCTTAQDGCSTCFIKAWNTYIHRTSKTYRESLKIHLGDLLANIITGGMVGVLDMVLAANVIPPVEDFAYETFFLAIKSKDPEYYFTCLLKYPYLFNGQYLENAQSALNIYGNNLDSILLEKLTTLVNNSLLH